jgi:2-polyprenyl-3-methyl-5-hydroxy-6-metoxy-1,4-benzoquinol methylase
MPNPSKQFFYDSIYKEISKLHFERVIDFACGRMAFLDHIKPKYYLGIDIDLERLKLGKLNNPQANYLNISINDFDSQKKKYDLVICFETIAINNLFKIEDTEKTLTIMSNSTSKDGHLILNFSCLSKNYEKKILDLLLKNNFILIKKKYYGTFNLRVNYFIFIIMLKLLNLTSSFFSINKSFAYIVMKKL